MMINGPKPQWKTGRRRGIFNGMGYEAGGMRRIKDFHGLRTTYHKPFN